MSKIKEFVKNISPLNNRTEMPGILYILKVIIIFWFVKFGAEVICEGVVILLHFACGKNPLKGEIFDYSTITLITYYGYSLMIGIIIMYWKLFQKKSVSELGFTKKAVTCFMGAIIGAVLVLVSVVIIVITGAITYEGVFKSIDYVYILLMLGGFIFQGALEEVLCRGVVLQLLKEKTSVYVAIGISTLLFIIPHISKMTEESGGVLAFAIINLILISFIFSIITLYFKSIWPACGLHSIWNYVLYNILGLNLSGNDKKTAAVFNMKSNGNNILNGGIYGIEASVITAIVLATTLVIMNYSMRKREVKL